LKALVISVGTGTSLTKEAVDSLAKAITFGIRHHNPDKTFFVVSQQSKRVTMSQILRKTQLKDFEQIIVKSPDNIQQIYEELQPSFQKMRQRYSQIAVDYTSGTKAMTGALTILGATYEVDTLSYITGKRKGGIVQAGTEEIRIIRPYFATTEQKVKMAVQLFNRNQFDATITLLNQIRETTVDPTITTHIKPILDLAEAYGSWDRFQHQEAFQTLRNIDKKEIAKNKRFLGQLLHTENPEPYYIADLLNNARRRGTEEKRYDDAVARLYRTIELVAQHQLKAKYEIQTSDVKPQQIPKKLVEKWNITADTRKIRLPLDKAYELLKVKHDPIGQKFAEDRKLRHLLSQRNKSILAHNLKPVTQKTYRELYQKAMQYTKTVTGNLDKLIEDSTFTKWMELDSAHDA